MAWRLLSSRLPGHGTDALTKPRTLSKEREIATAVITGTSTGTGLATAVTLARAGYAGERRLLALFHGSLDRPVSPYVVGEKIREVVESDGWQLRHLVGPDAAGFLKWRGSLADEERMSWAPSRTTRPGARVQKDFGMDVRAHLKARTT